MYGHIGLNIASVICLTITFVAGFVAVGESNWGSNPHHVGTSFILSVGLFWPRFSVLTSGRSLERLCTQEYSFRPFSAPLSVGAILKNSANELHFTRCCTIGLAVASFFSDSRRSLWAYISTDRPLSSSFYTPFSWACSPSSGLFLNISALAAISLMGSPSITRGPCKRCRRQDTQPSLHATARSRATPGTRSPCTRSPCTHRNAQGSVCFQMCSKSANRG